MTGTYTPKELLEEIGKKEYYDVSETHIKEEGQYVAIATRRLRHIERSNETVIEPDDRFQGRDLTSFDGHPDGYNGHDLPMPAEWAQEHGKEGLNNDSETVTHELKKVASRNEKFGACSQCEGTGRTVCSICAGTGRKSCSVCNGTGDKTVYEPCEACAGQGDIERTVEKRCRNCKGNGTIEEDRREIRCPTCDGIGTEQRKITVRCKVCDGTAEKSIGNVPCENCDRQNEVPCENCDESNRVECSQCRGDGEVWEYERVTDRYQVEQDVSIEPSPSPRVQELISADEIDWERVADETRETDLPANETGMIREQEVTLQVPMQIVAYSPVEVSSAYSGETYEPWKGGAQIKQVGTNVETMSADFGEITRPGFEALVGRVAAPVKSVAYALPMGFVLAIALALGLTQLDSDYGLARNAVGGIVALAVLSRTVAPATGYALGIVLISLFASAPALGVASTEQAVNGVLFGVVPILIGTCSFVYRYLKRNR
jgi:hypothetical protein